MHLAKPWMSTDDIQKGERWNAELSKSLGSHAIGIICVTPENSTEPWLTFEAGALSRSVEKGKVMPLLLGMSPDEIEGPLKQFQITKLEKKDIFRLLRSLNDDPKNRIDEDVLKDSFNKYWSEFQDSMKTIAYQSISGDQATVTRMIRALAHHGIDRSNSGYQTYFTDGFESHGLYSSVTETANKRLLVFGRKNRKLFDKNYGKFFGNLKNRIAKGLDFRVMYLDPKSPREVLYHAHHDDDLDDQIRESIGHARKLFDSCNLNMSDHCRTYNIRRTISFLVVDNAVVYSTLALDESGRTKPLTESRFTLVDAWSPLGLDMVSNFETLWKLGPPVASS